MALTYITNGKIVLPDSVVCGKFLAFDSESGKICGIVDELPAGACVIDAEGNYVAPGLIDIHIHISARTPAMRSPKESRRWLTA